MSNKGTATFVVKAEFTITKDSMGWDVEPTRDDVENELYDVRDALGVSDKSSLAESWSENAELVDVEWEKEPRHE